MIRQVRGLVSAVAALALAGGVSARAGSFEWDADGVPPASGGTGAWDVAVSPLWFDGTNDVAWPASGTNDAVFSGTAGTVTLAAGGVTAHSLAFAATGYTVRSNSLTLNGVAPTVTVGPGLSATLAATLAGSAGLNKAGAGTLVLGNNGSTYSGGTTVSGGTLNIAVAGDQTHSAVGVGQAVTVNAGATLRLGAGDALGYYGASPNTLTLDGGTLTVVPSLHDTIGYNGITLNAGTITAEGAGDATGNYILDGTVTVLPNAAASIIGAPKIAIRGGNGANLTITFNVADGAATTDLSVSSALVNFGANVNGLTKTGAGTLALGGANTYTGVTGVNGGTLVLEFAAAGAPANNAVSANSALALGGGTLSLVGKAATNDVQTFNGTTLNGGASAIALASGTGGSLTLNLGALTRNAGGTVNFTLPDSGSITTTTGNTNGILGPWATLGADFAMNDGTGRIVASTNYNDIPARGPSTIASDATLNVRINSAGASGSIALAATNTTINTLLQGTATAATVDTAGKALKVGSILVGAGQEALTLGAVANDGTLAAAAAGGELTLINNGASLLTVNALIADNTTASPLFKAGDGTVLLAGANTFSGTTTLLAGTLRLGSGTALGTGAITLAGGSLDSGVAGLVNSGNNAQNWNGDFGFVGSQSLNLGTGAVTLSGNRQVTVNASALTVGGTVSGAYGIAKAGGGTLALTGSVAYTGATTVNGGTLRVEHGVATHDYFVGGAALSIASGATFELNQTANTARYSSVSRTVTGAGTFSKAGSGYTWLANDGATKITTFNQSAGGLINVRAGTLASIKTAPTHLGGLTIAAGAVAALDNYATQGADAFFDALSGGGTLNYDAGATARTVNVGVNHSSSTFSGVIANGGTGAVGLTKAGTGTLTLSGVSTYTGPTTVGGGTLRLGGAGQLGSGAYAGAVSVPAGSTLALGSSAAQTLSGPLSGGGTLLHSGAGTLTLGGTNSFRGGITNTAGKLVVNGSLDPAGTVAVVGGTFGGTGSAGATTLADGITLEPGSGGSDGLTLSRLLFNGRGTITGTLGAATLVAVTGDVVTGGGSDSVTFVPAVRPATGTYRVLSYGSGADPFGAVRLGVAWRGLALVDNVAGRSVDATMDAGLYPVWTGALSGEWSTNALAAPKNWAVNTGGQTDFLPQDNVRFDDTATGATNVVLNGGNVTPFSTTFDNTLKSFSVAGAGSVTSGPLLKTGAGGVTIGNANAFTSATVSNGTLVVAHNNAINGMASIALTMAGGTLRGGAAVTLPNAVVAAGDFGLDGGAAGLTLGGAVNIGAVGRAVTVNNAVTVSGVIGGTGALTKTGPGTLTLTAKNQATGPVTVNAGTLNLANGVNDGTGTLKGSLTVSNATVNVTGENGLYGYSATALTVTLNAGSVLNLNIANKGCHLPVCTFNGGTLSSTSTPDPLWGGWLLDDAYTAGGNAVSTISASQLVLYNGAVRTVTVNAGATLNVTGSFATKANNLNTGGLIKAGDGPLVLSNGVGYSGPTTVNAGLFRVDHGALTANDYFVGNGALAINAGGTFEVNQLSGSARYSTVSRTVTGAGTFSKTGAGLTWTANDSGATITTFDLATGGLLNVQAGTLSSVKTAATNKGGLTVVAGAIATLDNNATQGADAWFDALNGGGSLSYEAGTAARTITVGAAGGSGAFGGVIANGGTGAVGLTKTGTGTQTLSGRNTYSGRTTVSGGALRLGADDTLNATHELTLSGGALDAGTAVNHLGTLTLAGGVASAVRLEAGAELSFKASDTVAWNGSVTLEGELGPTSLRFGTDRTGLTAAQLQVLTYRGNPATLDAQGYVVATRPGTTLIVR